MEKQEAIKIFDEQSVRTLWDIEHEKWYISIVDVIAILMELESTIICWQVLMRIIS
jgi:hypothetical protein